MNPLYVLSAVVAAASAAPSNYGVAPLAAVAPAPLNIQLPAPYSTQAQGAPVTTIHQAPSVQTKQVHLGATTYVSGHTSEIIKPPTPVLPISVPTALKGTTSYNAPVVKTVAEVHTVQQPIPVEKRVQVPYDVPVIREQINKIPTPVHVRQPYAVPVPTPVEGQTFTRYAQTAPVVHREHTNILAQPALAVAGYSGYPAAAGIAYNGGYAAGAYAPGAYATGAYAAGAYAPALAAAPAAAVAQY